MRKTSDMWENHERKKAVIFSHLWVLSVPQDLNDIRQSLPILPPGDDHLTMSNYIFFSSTINPANVLHLSIILFSVLFDHISSILYFSNVLYFSIIFLNNLKKSHSSSPLSFPVLWVGIQSLKHVERLAWWWWWWWWWWLWQLSISNACSYNHFKWTWL